MGGIKYDKIYQDLKYKIEVGKYNFQQLIPSEMHLIQQYECSRNTVRRAIANLVSEGYLQSIHGKGVRVIYQPYRQSQYSLGKIESFKEAAKRNNSNAFTKVILFLELKVDKNTSNKTFFPENTDIYYIQRVRYIDNRALIIDHNYFRKDIVNELTKEIAAESIYEYIENVLNINIVTTKRMVTVERIVELDEKYLQLNDMNCVAVVSNRTYNDDGIMFEFTQSRHHPDYFVFYEQAQRNSLKKQI